MEDIPVLYEDTHVLVVEKPVNIPSQGDKLGSRDMLTILKESRARESGTPLQSIYLAVVHRLDRPAGGVMVFAKTPQAAGRLSESAKNKELTRAYLAVIHGVPATPAGCLEHYLIKQEKSNYARVVPSLVQGAKKAILDYQVVSTAQNLSLARIHLHTGRHHQIRAQFAAVGHPLYGDQKYGSNCNKPGEQLALWSAALSFHHPFLHKNMEFSRMPPAQYPWNLFADCLAHLENPK